jgi:large subunit ribosomal protein L10
MSKTRVQKKELIAKYQDMLNNFSSVIVLDSKGITPNEINEFKKEIFQYGAEVHVIKNTLFKRALNDNGFIATNYFENGSRAVLFAKEDFVSPAKSLKKFIDDTKIDKNLKKIEIVGAYLQGEILDKTQASEISEMPTKPESVSMILGILDMSVTGIMNVLEDAPRSIVSVLDQAFKE